MKLVYCHGMALIQVLIMSVILLILATGVMNVVFSSRVLVARAEKNERARNYIDSCLAQKNEIWNGQACFGSPQDGCDYRPEGGPAVYITCSGEKVTFKVKWK